MTEDLSLEPFGFDTDVDRIMNQPSGYKDLEALFKSETSLPQLPGAAMRLIQILDDEEVCSTEVERVIMGDPALTAAVIRSASAAVYGGYEDSISTVRGAIARLGHRAVQSVAVSLGVQALMGQSGGSSSFDRNRFAKHSIFVGFLARYIYACRFNRENFKSRWSRDEIFAAGVLHDLALGLLSRVDPSAYDRVFQVAKKASIHMNKAFQSIYREDIGQLGVLACQTWNLPPMFAEVIGHYESPLNHASERISLACVQYSAYLADQHNFGIEPWKLPASMDEELLADVGLPEDDVPNVVMLVARHTAAYVPTSHAA
jgi:HD-like signal output (HDOD) protein